MLFQLRQEHFPEPHLVVVLSVGLVIDRGVAVICGSCRFHLVHSRLLSSSSARTLLSSSKNSKQGGYRGIEKTGDEQFPNRLLAPRLLGNAVLTSAVGRATVRTWGRKYLRDRLEFHDDWNSTDTYAPSRRDQSQSG